MKNEEREHLIALPATWYYLNACDNHTVEIYRVDPEQTFLGNAMSPARLAVLEDSLVGKGLAVHQLGAHPCTLILALYNGPKRKH